MFIEKLTRGGVLNLIKSRLTTALDVATSGQYALDAAAGKILYDRINSTQISSPTFNTDNIHTSDSRVKIQRSGNIVCLNGYIRLKNTNPNGNMNVGTIPAAYYPTGGNSQSDGPVRFSAIMSTRGYSPGNGEVAYMVINLDGTIGIWPKAGNTYDYAIFSISYYSNPQ